MIEVKVPGKLYIVGEYSVVNPGNSAVLMSVNKYITVKLKKSSDKGSIKSYSNIKMIYSRIGSEIVVDQEDDRFLYIFKAINIAERFLLEKGILLDLYDIEVISELESKEGLKYGLGSSAAIIVSVIKAILEYYRLDYSKMELFKLSVLANISINTSGSCGDIASAVFKGIIKYTSFDRQSILERLEKENIIDILNSSWEFLSIEKININKDLNFLVGWTKTPVSSNVLVMKSNRNIKKDLVFYKRFISESEDVVCKFVEAYIKNDFEELKIQVEKNRVLLNEYSEHFGISIENNQLNELIEISKNSGLASKTSGAGGGDCGIAIYPKNIDISDIIKKWKENDIQKLDLKICEE